MRVSSQRVLHAVLASCLSVAVVEASHRRAKQGDEEHELPIASSTTSQARKLETGKAPPPTAEPTPYNPPVDDDYYYPGYDDYANGGATSTPQPTTTWHPTDSPYPTRSPYPTATLPYYTKSPYPTTPGTTKSPYPTPVITTSPYPTPDYTAPPPPTPDSHDVCMYKPLTITVDLDDYTSLVFCCVQGTGDFDVHSAFDFEGCSLVPPPDYDYPTPVPTPTPPYESAPPTPHPYPAHPPVDKVIIHLALKTDHYPDQTSFTLQDAASGEYLWDYDYEAAHWQPNSPYHYQVEVDPAGCYYFIIQDSWGDGLASWGGSFELFYAGYLTWYGSMFGKYSSVAVGAGCYVAH